MPKLINVETDPIEAAAKKAKIKQSAMRQAKIERDERNGKGYISKSVRVKDDGEEEYGSDLEDEEFDSDEMYYDSEEEELAERADR